MMPDRPSLSTMQPNSVSGLKDWCYAHRRSFPNFRFPGSFALFAYRYLVIAWPHLCCFSYGMVVFNLLLAVVIPRLPKLFKLFAAPSPGIVASGVLSTFCVGVIHLEYWPGQRHYSQL